MSEHLGEPVRVVNIGALFAEAIARTRAVAFASAWPGRTGGNTCRALLGLLDLSEDLRTATFGCSVRQLANVAGMGTSAAGSAIKRLIDMGWITRIENAHDWRAAIYKLHLVGEDGGSGTETLFTSVCRKSGPLPTPTHDPAFWLRPNSFRIYTALAVAGPQTKPQLVTLLSMKLGTLKENLRFLRGLGLVMGTANGFVVTGMKTADTITGTALDGRYEARVAQHAEDAKRNRARFETTPEYISDAVTPEERPVRPAQGHTGPCDGHMSGPR
ncbi:MAG: hypothetical protein QOD39_3265 [Mycobacterium sp.]|nr:hypothetical protein [Mycobacterium sp.]